METAKHTVNDMHVYGHGFESIIWGLSPLPQQYEGVAVANVNGAYDVSHLVLRHKKTKEVVLARRGVIEPFDYKNADVYGRSTQERINRFCEE